MMFRLRRVLFSILFCSFGLTSSAQVQPGGTKSLLDYPYVLLADETTGTLPNISDSVFNKIATSVKFEVNKSEIDKSSVFYKTFENNILPILRKEQLYPLIVCIRGAASPDGSYENNRRLGSERAKNVMKLVCDGLKINPVNDVSVTGKVITEDYGYLAKLMNDAKDKDAARVQQLLDSCKWDEKQCKLALQKEQDGKLWRRLIKDYFPSLRNARLVMVMGRKPDPKREVIQHGVDTIYVRDTVYVSHTTVIDDTDYRYHRQPETSIIYRPHQDSYTKANDSIPRHPLMAIKTNLLFDIVTAINASVEVPLGKYFSISAEVVWPWWVDKKNQWCMQLGNVGLEGRYYFRTPKRHSTHAAWYRDNDRPLTGFFIGVHADGAYYDFEWKGSGRQGEAWIGGITIGYQKRLSRYFNMEYSLGIGAARHKYRTYDATESGDHLWRRDTYTDKTYFGPTKAKISLVWLLYSKCGKKCQKGGAK